MFESQLLHPASADLDTDDYPQLLLTSATVVHHRRGHPETPVDLFSVVESGPFRVKGLLQRPSSRKLQKLFRAPSLPPKDSDGTPVVIPGVVTYSIERQRDDVVIWALGGAAWYELRPEKEYDKAFFRGMREKGEIWMWLQERYGGDAGRHRGRKGKAKSKEAIDEVYEEFAKDTEKSKRQARLLFERHRRYLLMMMLKRDGGKKGEIEMWRGTPIYREWKECFRDTVQEVEALYSPPASSPRPRNQRQATPPRRPSRKPLPPGTTITVASAVPPSSPPPPAQLQVRKSRRAQHLPPTPPSEPPPSPSSSSSSSESEAESDTSPSSGSDSSSSGTPQRRRNSKHPSSKGTSILRPARRPPLPLLEPAPSSPPPHSPLSSKRPSSSTPSLAPPPQPKRKRNNTLPSVGPWKCSLGCDYTVGNPRTREGRREVEVHYNGHGKVFGEALATVESEVGEGQCGFLMMKLKGMEREWVEGRPSPLKGLGEV